jgi:uncharacterized OB-fold protein
MTWEPRPLPKVTPETAEFWKAATEGELLLGKCAECGSFHYYPRRHCPDCFSDDVDWVPSVGTGEIYSYSYSEQVAGWPEEDFPHVVGYVELEEGPRVIGQLVDCDPEEVSIGTPVAVEFRETEDEDVAIPVFSPTE